MRRVVEISKNTIEMDRKEFADFIALLNDIDALYHHIQLHPYEKRKYDDAINVDLYPGVGYTPHIHVYKKKREV